MHNVQTRSAFVMCPALICTVLMFSVIRGFSGSKIHSLCCSCEHGTSADQLMISPAVFLKKACTFCAQQGTLNSTTLP